MKIVYSAATDKGRRQENQDKIFIDTKELTFAVFDGMGGEQCGEVASEIASNTMKENFTLSLTDICMKANANVCRYMKEHHISCMGTTAAIVRFDNSKVEICNIGDSRVYKFANNEFEQLSCDHVMNIGMFKTRRILTQYLGIPEDEMIIEPHTEKRAVESGEIYLICSDGLTDMVTDEVIIDIITKSDVKNAAENLVQVALANGGNDNISVIVCKVID